MGNYLKQRKVWLWIAVNIVGLVIGGGIIASELSTVRLSVSTLVLCGTIAGLLQAMELYFGFRANKKQVIQWLGISAAGWSIAVPIALLIQIGYAFLTVDFEVLTGSSFHWLAILIGGLSVSFLQAWVLYPEERKYPHWEMCSAIGWILALVTGSIIVHFMPGGNTIKYTLSGGIAGILIGVITGWVLVKNDVLDESALKPRRKVVRHKALQILSWIILALLFLLGLAGFVNDVIRTFKN